MMNISNFMQSFLPEHIAYAHCDIPCGIYDPKGAQTAALTVQKMVKLMLDLAQTDAFQKGDVSAMNSMARMVLVKEEHARKCKEEMLVLWTDYFKQEDLEGFPDLHTKVWKTAKLVSKNKQEVSMQEADALVTAVNEIAEIFTRVAAARAAKAA